MQYILYSAINLDVRTLLIILFWGNLVSTLLIGSYLILVEGAKDYRLSRFYVIAKPLQAFSYVCLFFRGSIPDDISVTLGNTLGYIGYYFEARAMFIMSKERNPLAYRISTMTVIAAVVLFNLIDTINPDPALRISTASLCIFAIFLTPCISMLCSKRISSFSRLVGIFYLLVVLCLLPRAAYVFYDSAIDIHTNFLIQSLTFFSLVLLLIFSLPAYLLLIKEKTDSAIVDMAKKDSLTQLANRFSFLNAANLLFERNRKEAKPTAVLFGDIDHFKHINDTHGHLFGDQVLVKVSDIIRASLRGNDLSCRYGGEEFLIFLTVSEAKDAHKIADRIMQSIAAACFPDQPDFRFTISFGLMEAVPQTTDTLMDFIGHADTALYVAKNSGRNRVIEYTSDLEPHEPVAT